MKVLILIIALAATSYGDGYLIQGSVSDVPKNKSEYLQDEQLFGFQVNSVSRYNDEDKLIEQLKISCPLVINYNTKLIKIFTKEVQTYSIIEHEDSQTHENSKENGSYTMHYLLCENSSGDQVKISFKRIIGSNSAYLYLWFGEGKEKLLYSMEANVN